MKRTNVWLFRYHSNIRGVMVVRTFKYLDQVLQRAKEVYDQGIGRDIQFQLAGEKETVYYPAK